MKTQLPSILVTTCALAGVATLAEASPSAPDFERAPMRVVDTSHAASDGRDAIEPLDVIAFDFDSASLDGASMLQVQQAARWLQAHPEYRLVIESHTDAAGSAQYNATLAQRRGWSIVAELVSVGVPLKRIVLINEGENNRPASAPLAAANRVAVLYPIK
jgi:outer membrane protein OmpA-like peptidoglycan-associated protein